MRDTFSLLRDLDFNCYVAEIKQMIANADPWLLGILVSMLVGVGHKIAIGHRVVYGWGLRLGALTFLCHAGYTLVRSGGLTENITAGLFARSAMVAGGVLAGVWILLPILLFVYVNFRFGLAGFLGYSGYALITAETLSSELLPGIALRGLLVAGLAMVLAWILRPIWEFLATICLAKSSTPSVPAKETDKPMVADPRLSRRERRRRRLARLRERRALAPVATAIPVEITSPWESEMRRRRDKARLNAELAYFLVLPQLGNKLPRDLFESWVGRYLGDHLPPEEVEENSWHFQEALRQRPGQSETGHANLSLDGLHGWFLGEQARIEDLRLDQQTRQTKLLSLQELYVSLSRRFLGDQDEGVVNLIGWPDPIETAGNERGRQPALARR